MTGNDVEVRAIHRPVLLREVLDGLRVRAGERYIDATLGQAGHSLEIARRGAEVLGIEANPKSFDWVKKFLSAQAGDLAGRVDAVLGNFINIGEIARGKGFEEVDGILFDLGLSTFELESSGLGFSYSRDEPLDMRLNQLESTETAADLVNQLEANELYRVLTKYGEERDAKKIVRAILEGRRHKKIETTFSLVSLIDSALQSNGSKELNNHRAKVFQALRIAVNRELENLQAALPQALGLIREGGRLCVISFHSLEDRIVKNFFRENQNAGRGKLVVEKPLTPGRLEVEENYSARSAKLRIFEKYD